MTAPNVPQKVIKAAGAFVMTMKRLNQGSNISGQTALLVWLLTWALIYIKRRIPGITKAGEVRNRKGFAMGLNL